MFDAFGKFWERELALQRIARVLAAGAVAGVKEASKDSTVPNRASATDADIATAAAAATAAASDNSGEITPRSSSKSMDSTSGSAAVTPPPAPAGVRMMQTWREHIERNLTYWTLLAEGRDDGKPKAPAEA
jgi:hypothetical protein